MNANLHTSTGRSPFTLPKNTFFKHFARCASAATLAAFLQFPAFSSCTRWEALPDEGDSPIYIHCTKAPAPEAIDLFFFDTLGMQRLDSYQQIIPSGAPVYGLSRSGARRIVALSGKSGETGLWSGISHYGVLRKHLFCLAEESAGAPLLYGQGVVAPGASRITTLELSPLLAAVRLRSVSCDFSGRPYEGESFYNHKLFLTFAGSESLPLGDADTRTLSWINPGFLDSTAVMALKEPSLLLQNGVGEVGSSRIYPQRDFYCYEGAPTHLVLEGQVGEVFCFYPIRLTGLREGFCLQLDVTLRRMGSSRADIPAESGAIIVKTDIVPWECPEPATIAF